MTDRETSNTNSNDVDKSTLISNNGDSVEQATGSHSSAHHSSTSHRHSDSGHSHHSHHHRHSSSRHRRKKTDNKNVKKFSDFIKYNKKYLTYIVIAVLLLTCMVFVGLYLDQQISKHDDLPTPSQDSDTNRVSDKIQIGVPQFSEDVVIVGPAVEAFMNAEDGVSVADIFDRYKSKSSRLDIGLPVELSYEITGNINGTNVKNAKFLVADNADMNNPFVVNKNGYDTKADFYHLKTGIKYYYQIYITLSDGAEYSIGGSFKTAPGPRVLTIEGVYNMRDIGGWTTSEGKEIKQGLLYRGCEIDGAVESKYTITQNGVNTMLTVLGIKTDMDLRLPTDNTYGSDALGSGVKHTYYSSPMYNGIFNSDENAEKVRKVFSDLANRDNYPIYIHCTYGTDRTGTICYLLGALLGMSEEDLLKDYQLSGLHHGDIYYDYIYDFIERVKELPGNSLKDKVTMYLISIGVTENEIINIRSIFLND